MQYEAILIGKKDDYEQRKKDQLLTMHAVEK